MGDRKRSGVKTLLAVEYGDANGMCRGPSAIKGKLDTSQLQSHLHYCVYWSLHHVHASNPIRTTFRFTVHFLKAKGYIPTRCVRHSRLRSPAEFTSPLNLGVTVNALCWSTGFTWRDRVLSLPGCSCRSVSLHHSWFQGEEVSTGARVCTR